MTDAQQIWPGYGFQEVAIPPDGLISRYLSDDGTATGDKNARVDGSTVPVPYWIEHAEDLYVTRMIVYIQDTGNFVASGYGALATLPTGVAIQVTNAADVVQLEITDGRPIQSVANWTSFCYDGRYDAFGSGDNSFAVRWTFRQSGGPLQLPAGWKLRALIQDDLTGLVEHRFHVSGVVVK